MSLNDKTRTAVFRVFQESLTNIARHAHATRVDVATTVEDAFLALRVQDNGNGMRPEALQNSASLGLIGMRERMHEVGGDVEISSVLGKGTTVVIRVPTG
jgi:signal transduction histidine kinase